MREILFRGKAKSTGKWVYGFLTYSGGNEDETGEFLIADVGGWFSNVVDPDTVGQYTGLTDKNGVKIFEGDIIKFYRGLLDDSPCIDVMKVVFNEISAMHMIQEWSGACYNLLFDNQPFYEVIGNIYDNPELLEATE